ncbi:hypothetical protein PYCC9005_005835 [Savitreella phatthalungensis]
MASSSDGDKPPGTPRFGQTSRIESPLVQRSNDPHRKPKQQSGTGSIFIQRKPHAQPFKPGRGPIDTTENKDRQVSGQRQSAARPAAQQPGHSSQPSQPNHFVPLPVNSDAWKQRSQLPSFKKHPSVAATPGRSSGPADWIRTPLQPPQAAPATFSPEWTRGTKPYRPPQPPPMFSLQSRELGKQSSAVRHGKSPVRHPPMQHGAPKLESVTEPYVDPGKATDSLKSFLDAFVGDKDGSSSNDSSDSDSDEDGSRQTVRSVQKRENDASIVPGLSCTLLPHQIKGLRFLQSREAGKLKHGGLLADDMGLGKTVQTIALLATRPRPQNLHEKCIRTTLVVAPLALIEQWAEEIRSKTIDLKVYVHHGPSRLRNARLFGSYDVVVTTYNILTQEHKGERDLCVPDGVDDGVIYDDRGCFGVRWWRIVLDEAHTIKNRSAKMTQAAYALRAVKRLCLTGTPIQNAADDLQSLLKFIRISPADGPAWWKEKISEPIARGNVATAIKRLHVILNGVMLRRTKAVLMAGDPQEHSKDNTPSSGGSPVKEADRLVLPPRLTRHLLVDFSAPERAFYDGLEQRADRALDRMKQSGQGVGYMSVLVLLQRLRQACNHAQLVTKEIDLAEYRPSPMSPKKQSQKAKEESAKELDDLAALLGAVTVTDTQKTKTLCSICLAPFTRQSPNTPSCQDCTAAVTNFTASANTITHRIDPSAKMHRLLDLLRDVHDDADGQGRRPHVRGPGRKTIVFSQWTSMLRLIGLGLEDAGIPYGLYHGGMSHGEREEALRELRVREAGFVLLTSLRCGAVGLNLVSASRVVLVDPWWNPAVEDQAIDRVHRIGQTASDVRVYRITVANTVEDRILKLQQAKRALAQDALAPNQQHQTLIKRDAKLKLDELLNLFAHG